MNPSNETLFKSEPAHQPLAYQMAPKSFDDYVGQHHILGPEKPLRRLIESDKLVSLILWGPPGCGKTSLSRLIAQTTKAHYMSLNAVTAKVSDIKSVIETGQAQAMAGRKTILFLDEIHRFNKLQQDALLPDVENGTLILVGATTENPFFSVIPGLLSRSQVFELHPLSTDALTTLFNTTIAKLSPQPSFSTEAQETLIALSQGDARKLLNSIDMAQSIQKKTEISKKDIEELLQTQGVPHSNQDHYDIISAFIKSIRGSDPDAALYWLARLIKAGEDPRFIARRLIILASEDIGNADPMALVMATTLLQAVQFIGYPEARINLAQVTTYLAQAPKSNASYTGINAALKAVESGTVHPVPTHLKDASYKSARKLGHGNGYLYPHDHPTGVIHQPYLPEPHSFYQPKDSGFERQIKTRLVAIKKEKDSQKNQLPNK